MSGVAFGRRGPEAIDRVLRRGRVQAPDYDHVGSTLGSAPDGVTVHHAALVTCGDLARARRTLEAWAPHAGIRGRVAPVASPELGRTMCVVVPWGPFELCAPVRVVVVCDEAEAVGFAYGTLPGHPERGEELFLAESLGGGRLRLSITVHAVPAGAAARVGAPFVRLLQRIAVGRYLDAWARAIIDPRSLEPPRR